MPCNDHYQRPALTVDVIATDDQFTKCLKQIFRLNGERHCCTVFILWGVCECECGFQEIYKSKVAVSRSVIICKTKKTHCEPWSKEE